MNDYAATPARQPAKRRRISTPEERLARAQQEVEKAYAYAARMAVRAEAARQREAKAATSLLAKTARAEKHTATGNKRSRKLDTRRKIIAGALALEHVQFDGRYGQIFRALLDEYVTRDQDRALFDLPPLPDDDQRRANPRVY